MRNKDNTETKTNTSNWPIASTGLKSGYLMIMMIFKRDITIILFIYLLDF